MALIDLSAWSILSQRNQRQTPCRKSCHVIGRENFQRRRGIGKLFGLRPARRKSIAANTRTCIDDLVALQDYWRRGSDGPHGHMGHGRCCLTFTGISLANEWCRLGAPQAKHAFDETEHEIHPERNAAIVNLASIARTSRNLVEIFYSPNRQAPPKPLVIAAEKRSRQPRERHARTASILGRIN